MAAAAVIGVVASCGERVEPPAVPETSPLDEAIGFDPMLGLQHRDEYYNTVADCLEEAGFEVPGIRNFADKFEFNPLGPVHLDAVQRAASNGESRYERVSSPVDDYAETLSGTTRTAFETTVYGNGSEPGCSEKARVATYGVSDSSQIEWLVDRIRASIDSDPRRVAVDRSWSECMDGRGYKFEVPADVVGLLDDTADDIYAKQNAGVDLANDAETEKALQLEVQLEDAYNECATEVGLQATMLEVTLDAQQEFVDQNPDLAQQIQQTG